MNQDEAVNRLEAIASVKPEYRPIVDVALAVVKAAELEVEKAEERARLAESLVKDVRPAMVELAKIASDAEARALHREKVADVVVKRVTDEAKRGAALGALNASLTTMASAVEKLRANQEVIRKDAVELLQAIHGCTRDQNGRSAIENRAPFAGSPWSVLDGTGALIDVVECRKDAVALVVKLLAEEKLEAQRAKQPGEAYDTDPENFVPGQGQATREDGMPDDDAPEWHASPHHPDDDEIVPGVSS